MIPKLELTAALLSVTMSIMLCRELKYNNAKEYFLENSQIVLSDVTNDAIKFHVFVANLIQQAKEHSDPSNWSYVHTHDNPADYQYQCCQFHSGRGHTIFCGKIKYSLTMKD